MNTPRMPTRGTPVLDGILNTLQQIVDYLPSLVIKGDGTTTSVSSSRFGTIVRAINVPRGAAVGGGGGGEAPEPTPYNGHFNIFTFKDSQDRTRIRITGGYFSVNGLVYNINTVQVLASDFMTSPGLYYAVLEIKYNKNTKRWSTPTFKFYNASDFASGNDYECKFPIGEVLLTSESGQNSYQVTCYEIQYPVLIVGGDCDS